MRMDPILYLQDWYAAQCDGDWEHQFGVAIDTLDNPGWVVRIDLTDTPLQGQQYDGAVVDRSESDWYRCSVEDRVFKGAGGPLNLADILIEFDLFTKRGGRAGDGSGT